MQLLQSQIAAAGAAQNAQQQLAAQQAAILQHQQAAAAEYQQLLLRLALSLIRNNSLFSSQGLSYEALTGAAVQYAQPQAYSAALLQQQYGDYAAQLAAAEQSNPGGYMRKYG